MSPNFFQKISGASKKVSFELPQFQSHRGLWKKGLKENTMQAFYESKKAGFKMVEFDVRCLSDGTVVCYHDADLLRLEKSNQKIFDLNKDQLKKFQIPTLQEILEDPFLSDIKLNVEVKSESASDHFLEKSISKLLQSLSPNHQKRIIFSSFNPISLHQLNQSLPEIPKALLVSQISDPKNAWYLKKMVLLPFIEVQLLHLEKSMATPEVISFYKKRNFKIALWTCTPEDPLQDYLDWGVDSLIVDAVSLPFEKE